MKLRLTTIAAAGLLGLGGVAATIALAPAVVSAATSDTNLSELLPERSDRIKGQLEKERLRGSRSGMSHAGDAGGDCRGEEHPSGHGPETVAFSTSNNEI